MPPEVLLKVPPEVSDENVLRRTWRNVMPITPMPENSIDAFMSGMAQSQAIFNALMQNRVRQQEANRLEAKSKLPFGGEVYPGVAGQVTGLEALKQAYGEESPQYQSAKKAFDLSQQATTSRINYQDTLAESMPLRYTTPQGRGIIEQSNVAQGFSPAGTPEGQPVVAGAPPYKSPYGTAEKTAAQYNLKRTKENIPTQVLQRNLFATNIDKTLGNLNIDDLVSYAGLKGTGEYLLDLAKAQKGETPERLLKYNVAKTAVDTLTKQVRQFYGDSITPSVQAGLKQLTNPATWKNNPELAKAQFEKFSDILRKETQTYRDATKGSEVYQGDEIPAENITPEEKNTPEKVIKFNKEKFGNKTMVKVRDNHTGKILTMTREEAEKLMAGNS
jgi:hypothetical protein